MNNFARIERGVVVELMRAATLPPFHPALQWIECPSDIQAGWRYNEGAFSEPENDHATQAMTERGWRDSELSRLIWLRDRHRDQQEINADTNLTSEQFTNLLVYIQALRDWSQSSVFPEVSARPKLPDFIDQKGGDQ